MAENKKQISEYFSGLPENSSPSSTTSMMALENGAVVKVPFNSLPSGDSSSGGYPYGLSNYFLPGAHTSTYMSAIKEKIETEGGDITKLNYINANGSQLLIKFAYVGDPYYVYCVDLLKLKSYYYSIDISTTTIADFLAMDSVAVGDESSSGDSSSGGDVYGLNYYQIPATSLEVDTDIYMSRIKEHIEEQGGSIGKLNYARCRGHYMLISFVQSGANTYAIQCFELNTGKIFNKTSVDISTTTIADFFNSETVGGSSGDSSTCQFPDYTATWNGPDAKLSDITDAIGLVEGQRKNDIVVRLKGYGSALLLCSIYSIPSGGQYSINARDIFTGERHNLESGDVTTITIHEFLNTDTYLVEDESSSSSDGSSVVKMTTQGNGSLSMWDIREAIIAAGKDSTVPTLVCLSGIYNNTLLIWFKMNGTTTGYVHCWDLGIGKAYSSSPITLASVQLKDFLSATYEAPLGSRFPSMTSITYDKLKALRDSGTLEAGMFYRITDYRCTTTQENTGAMNNQFDIIVQALNESTLSETASADRHEGDTYFADTNFGAWELKYCLDHDASRFDWAKGQGLMAQESLYAINAGDTLMRHPAMDGYHNIGSNPYLYAWATESVIQSGSTDRHDYVFTEEKFVTKDSEYSVYNSERGAYTRYTMTEGCNFEITTVESNGDGWGVIYYMKDEFGNECPYDFKNITYKGSSSAYDVVEDEWKGGDFGLKADTYYPTFANTSLMTYYQWGQTYGLARNSSIDTTVGGTNYYGYACDRTPNAWNTPDFYVTDAVISSSSIMYSIDGGAVSQISKGGSLTIKKSLDASLNGDAKGNVIEEGTTEDVLGEWQGKARALSYNILISKTAYNTFGKGSYSNLLVEGCIRNIFGNKCINNILSKDCQDNVFGAGCYNNFLGEHSIKNYFDVECSNNKLLYYTSYNRFEAVCTSNSLGSESNGNTFVNSSGVTLADQCRGNYFESCGEITLAYSVRGGIFESGVIGVEVATENCRNIRVCSGIFSYGDTIILNPVPEVDYPQIFKAKGTVETEIEIPTE